MRPFFSLQLQSRHDRCVVSLVLLITSHYRKRKGGNVNKLTFTRLSCHRCDHIMNKYITTYSSCSFSTFCYFSFVFMQTVLDAKLVRSRRTHVIELNFWKPARENPMKCWNTIVAFYWLIFKII